MSYTLYITREEPADEITLQEWLDFVKADREMSVSVADETLSLGDALRYENVGLAKWNSKKVFDYRSGRVCVDNPTPNDIAKMKRIAVRLNAQVIGDEGEEY